MQMDYTRESAKDFDATVAAVIAEIEDANFRVQAVHDVSAVLAEKGFARERTTIVELCNAKYASAVLNADVKIGLMLPCPILIYAEGGKIFASTMLPTLLAGMFPYAAGALGTVPAEVEAIVLGIVDRATT